MLIKRTAAIAAAFILTASLVSCSLPGFGSSDTSSSTAAVTETASEIASGNDKHVEEAFETITIDDVRQHVQETLNDIKISGNSEKVNDDIETLMYDITICDENYTRSQLAYYLDFENEDLESSADECFETFYISAQLVTYAVCHCYQTDEYKELVKAHIPDEEYLEAYTDPSMSLKRLEGYSKVDFDLMNERTDEYYELYMDEDMDDDEKALKCAELYLDLLTQYDTETFYDQFNRDYSPELAIELCDTAYEKLLPVTKLFQQAIIGSDNYEDIMGKTEGYEKPFETIRKYSEKLSDDLVKAADRIIDKELYYYISDESAFPGSFTADYPLSGDSVVFINYPHYIYSLSTAIHEFGHFYSAYYDNTIAFDVQPNLDVAEIQSQGFEFLFMQFYDDIYGDSAELMRVYNTLNMLDSIISGFLVGKFEYTVLSQRDTMTPQDVVDCWDDIMGNYTDLNFYDVNHIFENPGYYVSYAVSALAAFDIWEDCLYDPVSALVKYEKIAHIPANSPDTRFNEALSSCGFSEVLSKEYIEVLAEELMDYIVEVSI